jgi:hypothetical protein
MTVGSCLQEEEEIEEREKGNVEDESVVPDERRREKSSCDELLVGEWWGLSEGAVGGNSNGDLVSV